MMIKTFVFLDLETTGIPNQQNFRTKITEICLISVQSEHILLGAIPRVQNKLNLCFNPWKLIENTVEKITGLSNDLLEDQAAFDIKTYLILLNFLERLEKPICFVAHNGKKFDFPVLKYHIEKINTDFVKNIFCIDSYEAFKEILNQENENESPENGSKNFVPPRKVSIEENLNISDEFDLFLVQEAQKIEEILVPETHKNPKEIQKINETTPVKKGPVPAQKNIKKAKQKIEVNPKNDISRYFKKPEARKKLFEAVPTFKLTNIYEKLLKKPAENAHFAESDVKMMLECCVHLGEKFVDYANENAVLFADIPKMQPRVIQS